MYDLRILVRGNKTRKFHDNDGKIWIEGRPDSSFQVKVNNDNWNRVLAVVSVDGLNVIDGKHERPENSRGYILNSRSSIEIPGWKISQDEVKKFYFTLNGGESYVKKIGADEKNIGVIAAAIFKEKTSYMTHTWPPYRDNSWYPHVYSTSTDSTLKGAIYKEEPTICSSTSNQTTIRSMNTPLREVNNVVNTMGWENQPISSVEEPKVSVGSGERKEFRTHSSNFDRDGIIEMITIYYDTYEGLRKRGIINYDRDYKAMPQAFPGNGDYCPDV